MKKLAYNSSKQDEIKHLEKFIKTLEPDTYLSSLLTPVLVKWAKRQIELDISPDIMYSLKVVKEKYEIQLEINTKLSERIEDLKYAKHLTITQSCKIEKFKSDINDYKNDWELMNREIIELKKKNLKLKNALKSSDSFTNNLIKDYS